MPLIQIKRQRQAYPCMFEASVIYRASSRTAKATQRNPVSKNRSFPTALKEILLEKPCSRKMSLILARGSDFGRG